MGAVAKWLIRGVFAAAKQNLFAAVFGAVLDWHDAGVPVRTVAMRLGLAPSAGTPQIGFAAFKLFVKRLVAGNDGFDGVAHGKEPRTLFDTVLV